MLTEVQGMFGCLGTGPVGGRPANRPPVLPTFGGDEDPAGGQHPRQVRAAPVQHVVGDHVMALLAPPPVVGPDGTATGIGDAWITCARWGTPASTR